MAQTLFENIQFLLNSFPASAGLMVTLGICDTAPSPPDLSQCAEGEAIVECTYQEDLVYPECPQDDESSPWVGECTWRDEGGLYGRSGWTYPACPTNQVCVPEESLDDLRDAIEDGDFSEWCYPSPEDDPSTWVHLPDAPGPQPCVNYSVTWAPQADDGGLAL